MMRYMLILVSASLLFWCSSCLGQCIYELSGEGGLACKKAQGTRSSVTHVAYPKIHLAGLEQAVSWSLVVLEMSLCCADTWLELGVCWY